MVNWYLNHLLVQMQVWIPLKESIYSILNPIFILETNSKINTNKLNKNDWYNYR